MAYRLPTEWLHRMHSWRLLPLIGLPVGCHLPKDGLPVKIVHGVHVWVEPKVSPRRKHRVRALCPVCGTDVSAGRLWQHAWIHRNETVEE